MRNGSIRRRMITALIGFAILPVLLLGAVTSWFYYVSHKHFIEDLQKELTVQLSSVIILFFHEQEQKILSLISANYLPGMTPEEQKRLLSRVLFSAQDEKHRYAFEELSLIGTDGRERVRVSRISVVGPDDLADRSGAGEFVVPLEEGRIYKGPIEFSERTAEPFMTMGVPIIDLRTRKVTGVVTARMKLQFLGDMVGELRVRESGTAYVVDSEGRVIVHPNPSIVLRGTHFDVPEKPGISKGLSGVSSFIVAERIPFDGRFISFVVEMPTWEAFGMLRDSMLVVAVIVLLALGGSIGAGLILGRRFVGPIESLAEAAKAVSEGDLTKRAELVRQDEIGELATTFNTMTSRLVETIQELETERNFVKNSLEALTHPFYVIDARDYTIKLANSAAHFGKLSGVETCYQLTHKSDTACDGSKHPCTLKEIRKTGEPIVVEHVHYVDGDTPNIFEVYGYPIFDEAGDLAQVIEYNLNVTEKKELEKQLRQAQKMEAIGTLAGGIAHDFNNILSVILGYPQLAAMHADDPKTLYQYLEEVFHAGLRAQDLVHQILAFSRMSEMEKQNMELAPLVKETLKMIRSTLPSTIEIRQNLDSHGAILADATQMHQVIMNLCTNAYQAMRETGGVLAVSLEDVDIKAGDYAYADIRPGKYVRLEVSDTGIGMDAETKSKIFEPYFTTKQIGEGTGMGLAVVHGIVKGHDGNVTVYSEPGQGTTIHVYLPLVEGGEQKGPVRPDAAKTVEGGTERILFVDDENKVLVFTKEALTRYGYHVSAYADPTVALKDFMSRPEAFDLVMTDMTMPKITGMELALRCMEIRPQIPVILCTGYSDLINREKAMAMGIAEYVQKPFVLKELLAAVRRVLKEHSTQGP